MNNNNGNNNSIADSNISSSSNSDSDSDSNSNIREVIVCEDVYEAEKLMWILSRTGEHHILRHATAVDEELILVLDDDSSHSITMSDKESATRLQEVVDRILFDKKIPYSIHVHRNMVHIDMR